MKCITCHQEILSEHDQWAAAVAAAVEQQPWAAAVAAKSEHHRPCRACGFPTAETILSTQGLCELCLHDAGGRASVKRRRIGARR